MKDDIVTRLRDVGFCGWDAQQEAADEIERLRTALQLAVGELSTHDPHRFYSPDQLYQQFLEEAGRG